jgi:hypothetical protein
VHLNRNDSVPVSMMCAQSVIRSNRGALENRHDPGNGADPFLITQSSDSPFHARWTAKSATMDILTNFGFARAEQSIDWPRHPIFREGRKCGPSLPRPEFINAAASEEARVIGTGLLASGPTA